MSDRDGSLAVDFESGGEQYSDGMAWRPLDEFEQALLRRLLGFLPELTFPAVETWRVRALDECKCIEVQGADQEVEERIVGGLELPLGHPDHPLEVLFWMRGDRSSLLEFNHYGAGYGRRPRVEGFELTPR